MTQGIRGRIFLFGCPRSGTTLLQALLTAHPQVASFPETLFFMKAFGQVERRIFRKSPVGLRSTLADKRDGWLLYRGILPKRYQERVAKRTRQFLTDVDREDLAYCIPESSSSLQEWVNAFVRLMDVLTLDRSRNVWVEKTPYHLYYIDRIQRYIPNARFIHLVRNGSDVVASLYDAAQKYQGEDLGATQTHINSYRDVDKCIEQWNRAVSITEQYLNHPHHIRVYYEDLVADTTGVLRNLCEFLELDRSENTLQQVLQGYGAAANQVVLSSEPWKAGVKTASQMLASANGTKFETLFDTSQRRYILDRLLEGHSTSPNRSAP
ncbi:MAG: sulfotransferase [Cyanobacteria bacterium SID2]|nr:sulfotransferase [Cyanobacteria bacterium SID2]MBP0006064.1 sulfotransferase [Cyanobacteria bacterium SBC]